MSGKMRRLKDMYQNYAFSPQTYGLLNYFTLSIQDPDIRNEFDRGRVENFARLFKPCIFVVVAQFIVRLGLYLWIPDTYVGAVF
jgi:hypothetical protein